METSVKNVDFENKEPVKPFPFRTLLTHPHTPRPITFPETRNQYAYEYEKDKNGMFTGRKVLKKTGETNFVAMIQEGKDDNTPQSIYARMQRGDMTALGEIENGFLDALAYPKNFMESQNVLLKMQNLYNSLDAKQKAEYDNDINVFVKKLNVGMEERLKQASQKQREELVKNEQQPSASTSAPQQQTEVNNNAQQ